MPRNHYDAKFKEAAIKLAESEGITKAAESVGVSKATLSRWCKADDQTKSGDSGISAHEQSIDEAQALLTEEDFDFQTELQRLYAENTKLRNDNAKLKKALAALINPI